jgi:hypothetical protein
MTKGRQDEALWLVHWLNTKTGAADQSEQRRNVFLALAGIALALLVLAGAMIWTAWE